MLGEPSEGTLASEQNREFGLGSSMYHLNNSLGCLRNTSASRGKQQPLFSVIGQVWPDWCEPVQWAHCIKPPVLKLHPPARDRTKCDCPRRHRLLTKPAYVERGKGTEGLNWQQHVIFPLIRVFPAFKRKRQGRYFPRQSRRSFWKRHGLVKSGKRFKVPVKWDLLKSSAVLAPFALLLYSYQVPSWQFI